MLLLDDLGETIVPATPGLGGARAAAIGLYMIATVNTCWPLEEAQAFVRGLDALEAACAREHGYLTSELGATQALRYDPVPGSYRRIRYAKGDRRWAT